jgi:hypothetical protein
VAGYSQTPLIKKLGIKPGTNLLVRHEPAAYWDWIGPLPDGASARKGPIQFIHLFFVKAALFQKEVLALKKRMHPDGVIWISWPKKSSGVATDLDENKIRDFALANDLVDVKVCAVDETWSGLKLVIPVTKRKYL